MRRHVPRPDPAGPARLMAAALLALATSACGPGAATEDRDAAGCGRCERETTAVGTRIARIDGVTDLVDVRYAPRKNVTRSPTVNVVAEIQANSLDRVRPALVRAVWDSAIAPLDYLTLDLRTPGGEGTFLRFQFTKGTREYAAYRDAWGARPVT